MHLLCEQTRQRDWPPTTLFAVYVEMKKLLQLFSLFWFPYINVLPGETNGKVEIFVSEMRMRWDCHVTYQSFYKVYRYSYKIHTHHSPIISQ